MPAGVLLQVRGSSSASSRLRSASSSCETSAKIFSSAALAGSAGWAARTWPPAEGRCRTPGTARSWPPWRAARFRRARRSCPRLRRGRRPASAATDPRGTPRPALRAPRRPPRADALRRPRAAPARRPCRGLSAGSCPPGAEGTGSAPRVGARPGAGAAPPRERPWRPRSRRPAVIVRPPC